MTIAILNCRQLSTKADIIERELTKTNRFYPLPSELKQDEFLANLFTPRNGIKELCNYLIGLIKDISTLYRKEGEYNDIFNQLYRESLFQSFLKINRLYDYRFHRNSISHFLKDRIFLQILPFLQSQSQKYGRTG